MTKKKDFYKMAEHNGIDITLVEVIYINRRERLHLIEKEKLEMKISNLKDVSQSHNVMML